MALQPVPRDKHYDYIDGLRGIAVLAVVLFHAFHRVRGPHFAPYIFHVGTRGVDLFFVLSGFCLSLRAVSSPNVDNRSPVHPLHFIISRFGRVAPPYYVALGLFVALSFTPFGLPTATSSGHAPFADLPELIRDLAFSNVSGTPAYNASFWTLGIEMRWYFFYPLLVLLFLRSKIWFVCVALGSYALYATPWRVADAGTLPCFMLGIVAASLATDRHRPAPRIVFPLAAVVVFLAVAKQSNSVVADHGDALWHIACFLFVLAGSYGLFRRLLCVTPLRAVGIASYSIYLVHEPFLAWAITHGVPMPIAAIGAIGTGFVFWFAIERVAAKSWRRRIEAWAWKILPSGEKQALIAKPAISGAIP